MEPGDDPSRNKLRPNVESRKYHKRETKDKAKRVCKYVQMQTETAVL